MGAGSAYTLVSLSLRLMDLLGPVTRVQKKKKTAGARGLTWVREGS